MKSYTKTEPVFSDTIKITEVTDPGHADYINEAPKQLLENTLSNREKINVLENLENTIMLDTVSKRENIKNGDTNKTVLGKIARFFADLKTVAFTAKYSDLEGQPAGTLTIQKNGKDVQTFTANQNDSATANITVPTTADDIGAVAASKIMTTKEQIDANTDANNVAGAVALKSIKSDLTNSINQINSNLANKLKIVTILSADTRNTDTEYTVVNKANAFTYFIPIATWRQGAVVSKQTRDATYDFVECSVVALESHICVARSIRFLINKTTGNVKIEAINQMNIQLNGNFPTGLDAMDGVGLLGISW